ncbi:Aminopeptidase 2 [Neolecta irregularis DAH-3]|uniref:Aminopeptidase n=1 Tax=Neolecta irregularis (strain DAH-3) TaxID=1198029 RepID=A0A1U7LQF5_NEOID|nr:Aminopeptidase 2 [Neolecta irregularis DAH-3]|eukprot:OLL24887.1 Aminopeptidase 2 [Neolecta irregularis DAH-3]
MLSAKQKERQVLPTNVRPRNYKLTLNPDFKAFDYDGTVVVTLDVNETTNTIKCNSTEIQIHKVKIEQNGHTQTSSSITFLDDDQSATFTFDEALKPGCEAKLTIKFTGQLNDKMAGFYRSSYIDNVTGEKKYLATTQMEPTDCRRALPCFDEPALKATFDVSLICDKNLVALSNMDVIEEKDSEIEGKKITTFRTTPLMSTYLLAFIVGDLKYVETFTSGEHGKPIPVRVYATAGYEKQSRFALDLAAKTLDFFSEIFGIVYPLPKLDNVAIPDFSAGAMENWGLVTYRVVDLLYDEDKASAATKQRVAEVVQHELAHQWFGNLVTMEFWDGLWLNEGFATWMSWFSCNKFFPEWRVWESYVTDNLQQALRLDALRSSHPIQAEVFRADEINQAEFLMRSPTPKDHALFEWFPYLKKHAYGNTKTSDLWDALSLESGKDISRVMSIWTMNVGFPVITVTEDSNSIKLRQTRFLSTGDVKEEDDTVLYWVPLAMINNDTSSHHIESFSEKEVTIPILDLEFYKLNLAHSGIYRTNYPPERLQKLGQAGKRGLLNAEDRAGLVADAGALSASGHSNTSYFLNLVSQWTEESEFVVWGEMLARIGAIKDAWGFQSPEIVRALEKLTIALTGPKAKSLGWEFSKDEDHISAQFKALLFGVSGMAGDPEIVKAAQDMFEKFVSGQQSAIHPNIRGSVYSIVLKNGGEKEWNEVLNIYKNPSSIDEKNIALRSLGQTRKLELIKKTLDLALSEDVREQDIYLPFQGVRSHAKGIKQLWEFVQIKWDTIAGRLPPGLSMLSTVVQLCTIGFCSDDAIKDIKAFFSTKSTKGFNQGLQQSLDSIQAKASWVKRDGEDVRAWLQMKGHLAN